MKRRLLFAFIAAALLLQGCATVDTLATRPVSGGPENGTLIIVGGGGMPKVIFDRFFEAAGGKDAKLVVVPTAGSEALYDESSRSVKMFHKNGGGVSRCAEAGRGDRRQLGRGDDPRLLSCAGCAGGKSHHDVARP